MLVFTDQLTAVLREVEAGDVPADVEDAGGIADSDAQSTKTTIIGLLR